MAASESSQTYTQNCVIIMNEQVGYGRDRIFTDNTQTCVMYMKELRGYGRNGILSDIHYTRQIMAATKSAKTYSDLFYSYERLGSIQPRQNP